VARVEPSHDDCIQVPADPSTGSSVRWIVNPHTSCYLVGSASLASFTAYILRQQFRTQSALPLRLVSLGSVYHRSSGADVLPLNGESASHHQQPFQQRKQLSIAELSSSQRMCEQGFFQLVEDMYRFWTTFQPTWPLRLCYLPAGDLRPCEMLRAVIQLTEKSSPDGERHSGLTTVASVSLLDDWVSRRIGAKLSRSIAEFDPSEPYIRMTYAQIMDSYSLLTAFRRIGNMSISTI
ncbi:unnamed protein product, partial [Dicrocoelium dendriticum]